MHRVSWVERVADQPYVLARLIVLLAATIGYLTLFGAGSRSPWLDWGFALAAVAMALLGGVRPLLTAVGLAALLLAADLFGTYEHGPAVFVKYVGVWTLFELAVRRPWSSVAVGMAALTLAFTIHTWGDLPAELPSLLYRIAIAVAFPVLLGSYIRATRTLARETRHRLAQERDHHEERVRAAAVAERTVLARELHDMVAHHVSAMVLRAGTARHVAADADPRLVEALDDVHASATAALADLRHLVVVLRDPDRAGDDSGLPVVDPDGLPAELAALAERSRSIGVTVDVSADPEIGQLDPLRARTVLRVVQEGLANVARHAGASARASVSVSVAVEEADEVRLRVVDDGGSRVAAPPEPDGSAGFGLIGMRERVERLGGRLQAGPVNAGGWELTASLPTATAVPLAAPGSPAATASPAAAMTSPFPVSAPTTAPSKAPGRPEPRGDAILPEGAGP